MNTQEINKELDELEAGIKTLRERANEVENRLTERKGKWTPEVGDYYFVINECCEVLSYKNHNDSFDIDCLSIGNYYRTEAEATLARDNLITHEELSRLADYDGERVSWYQICYYSIADEIIAHKRLHIVDKYDEPRFASQESAQAAIEQIGEARLRKYLVGDAE